MPLAVFGNIQLQTQRNRNRHHYQQHSGVCWTANIGQTVCVTEPVKCVLVPLCLLLASFFEPIGLPSVLSVSSAGPHARQHRVQTRTDHRSVWLDKEGARSSGRAVLQLGAVLRHPRRRPSDQQSAAPGPKRCRHLVASPGQRTRTEGGHITSLVSLGNIHSRMCECTYLPHR